MHIIVSWDISDDDDWDKIDEELKQCIMDYSWVKPLTTFYIIQIDDSAERSKIKKSLLNICQKYKTDINIVISPIIEEGRYAGWLPKKIWSAIKERTAEEYNAE
ncbi:MAG: hypothetical protein LBS86_06265 [Treponema sp.]|jgi:hypothetical protein|nr:hypothetical protein [Treponema sp.]